MNPGWGRTVDEVLFTANEETRQCKNIIKPLVVLSGGMDSATCLALAYYTYGNAVAISFDYGQKHNIELEYAARLATHFNVEHKIINLNGLADNFVTALGKNSDIKIPNKATEKGNIPPTYVPFRNTIMLAIAAGVAQSFGYDKIFYGANIIDYSGYKDCRPEFINELNDVMDIHTRPLELFPTNIDSTTLAYFAGYWEADGHCSFYKTTSGYLGNVGLEQTKENRYILDQLQQSFGGQIVEKDPKYNKLSNTPILRWEIFGHKAKEALLQMLPFMTIPSKIEKSKAFIAFFSTTSSTERDKILKTKTASNGIEIPIQRKGNLIIEAPIIYLTKADVVRLGETLKVPWRLTWSCYRGGEKACGKCPSCEYRLKGFKEAGIKDPIEYEC